MACQSVALRRGVLAWSILLLSLWVLRPAHAQLPIGSVAPLNVPLLTPNGGRANVASVTRGRPFLLNFWSSG
jgi:hypothetical protein